MIRLASSLFCNATHRGAFATLAASGRAGGVLRQTVVSLAWCNPKGTAKYHRAIDLVPEVHSQAAGGRRRAGNSTAGGDGRTYWPCRTTACIVWWLVPLASPAAWMLGQHPTDAMQRPSRVHTGVWFWCRRSACLLSPCPACSAAFACWCPPPGGSSPPRTRVTPEPFAAPPAFLDNRPPTKPSSRTTKWTPPSARPPTPACAQGAADSTGEARRGPRWTRCKQWQRLRVGCRREGPLTSPLTPPPLLTHPTQERRHPRLLQRVLQGAAVDGPRSGHGPQPLARPRSSSSSRARPGARSRAHARGASASCGAGGGRRVARRRPARRCRR
jgi:hypothetical protein